MRKIIVFFVFLFCFEASAFFGLDGGLAQIPHLISILEESRKRYKQLENMKKMEDLIHSGSATLHDIEELIPLDAKTREHLAKHAGRIRKIYQSIRDLEGTLHRENDENIARSVGLHQALGSYTQRLDRNAVRFSRQAKSLSPKGAARAAVASNAQILHALNQLIKIGGQLLAIQSGKLALENRSEKEAMENAKEELKMLHQGFARPSPKLVIGRY